MPEYEIPFHIEEEILKRLPVKSLVQFRIVSKAWKSLIDSSQFIAAHSLHRHAQPQHLLVLFETSKKEDNIACFIDDETLFQQRPVPNSPPCVQQSSARKIVGTSHGLVCLYCPKTNVTFLWNPSIRKSIVVALPKTLSGCLLYVGFGVCPVTTDPKIVAIKQWWEYAKMETSYRCEVMVYTLSSGIWRSLSINLPTQPLRDWRGVVAADGFIYWFCNTLNQNMIMSFDVTNECFQMIDLPDTLARHVSWDLHNAKLRESLAILQHDRNNTYTIWKMEGGGVQRSFTKLFTLHATFYSLLGFRKSGVPILLVLNDEKFKLVVYEPNSEHNNVLQVSGHPFRFTVNSYTETLLLLGRSECSSC